MELKIGILMAGSLYWDGGRRKDWRDARLLPGSECSVSAPIRYGRQSSQRGNTYTMVFSGSCPPGEAKALACRNPISSQGALFTEAEYLWTAERLSDRANHRISASWGCVALLVRPGSQVPASLLKAWAARVQSEKGYGSVPQSEGERTLVTRTLVTKEGLLQIAWPELLGNEPRIPLDLDLLLATATHPTLEGRPPAYPSPRKIATAWAKDVHDEIQYFRNNRKNSIRTFEDREILEELRGMSPEQYETLT